MEETTTNPNATNDSAGVADAANPSGDEQIPQKVKGSRRPHGRGCIYMNLRDAEEAIRKIDRHTKRMSKDGFARALGHKKAEGRFFGKVEALKLFRLIDEDGDDIVLTPLAIDVLYGGNEAARLKARTTAFLSYDDFSKTFGECPKGQEHNLDYLVEYVTGKLHIVNEVDKFKRLFLESADFAGLVEADGELDLRAKTVRFRHAAAQPVIEESPIAAGSDLKSESAFETMGADQAAEVLSAFGLSNWAERAEVAQKSAGRVTVTFADGKIAFEVNRPVRVVVRNTDLVLDLPEMAKALRQKGFEV